MVPVDDDVPPVVASLLGCAVLTGGGAVLNAGRPRPGDTVAIVGILSTVVGVKFSTFRETQLVSTSVEEVKALLNEARSRTQGSENATQYGVHLETQKAVLFTGAVYSSSTATNRIFAIDSKLAITSISLQGGGAEIVFSRLTGDTSQYGTFIIKRTSTTSGQKTVTVSKTGLVSSN